MSINVLLSLFLRLLRFSFIYLFLFFPLILSFFIVLWFFLFLSYSSLSLFLSLSFLQSFMPLYLGTFLCTLPSHFLTCFSEDDILSSFLSSAPSSKRLFEVLLCHRSIFFSWEEGTRRWDLHCPLMYSSLFSPVWIPSLPLTWHRESRRQDAIFRQGFFLMASQRFSLLRTNELIIMIIE